MIIWMLLASIIAAVVIAAIVRSNNDDNNVLRHTIEVNLDILSQELETVAPLAESLTGNDKLESAKLIAHCQEVIDEVEPALSCANRSKLDYFLARVFRAMDSSSALHRILIKNDLLKPASQSIWHFE